MAGRVSTWLVGERYAARMRPGGDTLEFQVGGFAEAMRAIGCYTGSL